MLFICNGLLAQPAYQIPLYQPIHNAYESNLPDSVMPAFTSVRPYQTQWLQPWMQTNYNDTTHGINRLRSGYFLRYTDTQLQVWATPILAYTKGKVLNNGEKTSQNTRGIQAGLLLGKKVSIGFAFTENQGSFPQFADDYIKASREVIPGAGQGRNFKGTSYDYAFSDAYLRWTPSKTFSATLGYGQNFLGEGYRSLFLSDFSFNYPYVQLNLNLNKLHYTVLFNQYQNLFYKIGDRNQRKWSTVHYLTVKVNKRLHLGVIDCVIWQAEDSTRFRGFDLAYLNPVPFLRPIEFANGSSDNMQMGLHGKYLLAPKTYLYSQLFLDDFNFQASRDSNQQHLNNKYAIQVGVKHFKNIKGFQLFGRVEYNYARPYMYGHRKPAQNYTHYQLPLAHPLGANFHEVVLQINASKNRWYGELNQQIAKVGRENPATPYNDGNNVFGGEANMPNYGSYTLQGIKTSQNTSYLALGYLLNTKWNLAIEASLLYRSVRPQNAVSQITNWFKLGFVTRLRNAYWDF